MPEYWILIISSLLSSSLLPASLSFFSAILVLVTKIWSLFQKIDHGIVNRYQYQAEASGNTEEIALCLILFKILIRILVTLAKAGTLRKMWFHSVGDGSDDEAKGYISESTLEPYPSCQSFASPISKLSKVNIGICCFPQLQPSTCLLWVLWIITWNRYKTTL